LIQLNYRDSKPIYEQIKDGLRKGTFVAERKEVYDARAKELLTEFDEIVEELFFLSVKEKELVERMDNLAEGKVDQ